MADKLIRIEYDAPSDIKRYKLPNYVLYSNSELGKLATNKSISPEERETKMMTISLNLRRKLPFLSETFIATRSALYGDVPVAIITPEFIGHSHEVELFLVSKKYKNITWEVGNLIAPGEVEYEGPTIKNAEVVVYNNILIKDKMIYDLDTGKEIIGIFTTLGDKKLSIESGVLYNSSNLPFYDLSNKKILQ